MRPWGDRRARVRFEVVGALFGVLEVMEPASILNISARGALILSPHAVPLGSSQSLAFDIGGKRVPVPVTVRHIRAADDLTPEHFHVGVEFVSVPDVVLESMGLSTDTVAD